MPRLFSLQKRTVDEVSLDKTRSTSRTPTLSMIAAGMRVEGTIRSAGVVKIEGTVIGNIRSEHQVLVAAGGIVEGDIHTPEAIINGAVSGSIVAETRTELHSSSVVKGDITTKQLVVREGSQVNGRLRTGDQDISMERGKSRSIGEVPLGVAAAS
jgi:cytoskeletal protein CcmA (bactofilin family)